MNSNLILVVFVVLSVMAYSLSPKVENWGTSPATLIQLASNSGYYPYYRHGYGYNYPYYRYRYPYQLYYPMGYYPMPYGHYKYGIY